jgi:formamidopyrimidine-DNA glycosylase
MNSPRLSGILGKLVLFGLVMPELPEVEVTRLGVVDCITGAEVQSVRLGKPLRWPLGCEPQQLVGQRVKSVSRRGKYLWFDLGHAGGLLWHLGMSGSLAFVPLGQSQAAPGPHDHFDLLTSRGCLRLHDPRRFGAVVWGPALHEGMPGRLLHTLGVEPLSDAFTAKGLLQGLQGRKVAIKQALLAGDVVVGVGNIYASEALFRSRIHPMTPSHRVGPKRCERLVQAIQSVLSQAIEAGGSSLKDFRNAQGNQGHFQLMTAVYGRDGQPCQACQTLIKRVVQGQRATYFCPRCQR